MRGNLCWRPKQEGGINLAASAPMIKLGGNGGVIVEELPSGGYSLFHRYFTGISLVFHRYFICISSVFHLYSIVVVGLTSKFLMVRHISAFNDHVYIMRLFHEFCAHF